MKLKLFATALFVLVATSRVQISSARAQSLPGPDFSGNNPHWLEDPNSQCWVYDGNPSSPQGLGITWSGNCLSHLAEGEGTLSYLINGNLIETDTGLFKRGVELGFDDSKSYDQSGNLSIEDRGNLVNGVLFGQVDEITYMSETKIVGTGEVDTAGNDTPFGSGVFIDAYGRSHSGRWVPGTIAGLPTEIVTTKGNNQWTFVLNDEASSQGQQDTDSSSGSSQDQGNNTPTTQDYVNALQNTLGQTQQNINGQLSQTQAVHNQVQQELALRNAQALAARSQPVAPAPRYTPPPPSVVSAPDQQVASNSAPTAAPADQCVGNFYNSSVYGWFYWKDTCSFPITIAAELRNGTGTEGGVSTVYPESSDSSNGGTGLSPDEVNSGGGFVYAACPQGYIPTDTSTNEVYGNRSSSFYCKQGYVP